MDHQPLINYLEDKTRVVETRRLNNLRRKTDAYIFKIHYGTGIMNISNEISRIEDRSKETDEDRLKQVSDMDLESCSLVTKEIQVIKTKQNKQHTAKK